MKQKINTQASRIGFYGGTGTVSGSNFLFDVGGKKILVDCGFFQGCDTCDDKTRAPFPYDPKTIDYLFVTHAHLDHMGRIPKLVRDGFEGVIYSTPPTRDLTEIALFDSLEILREESKTNGTPLIFEEKDIQETLKLWKTVPYHESISLGEGLTAVLKDAGHILGSAMIEFKRSGKALVFTGDLGNSPAPLLADTESVAGAQYLIMESVYGDKNHESRDERREKLEDIIEEVALQKGTLLIPAFSIERTQEVLFEIEQMVEKNKIPPISVFLDSPLAIAATEIYKKHEDYFNKDVQYIMRSGDELFSFKGLRLVKSASDSLKTREAPNPKIIIAGSGMSVGGRVLYHEKLYLTDPKTTVLIVGYQAPGSLGRDLLEGLKTVSVLGEEIDVRAKIIELRAYSSHKDSDALVSFIHEAADTLKKVFVVMGEMKSSMFLTQRLRDYLGVNATVPREGDVVEIDF